MSIQKFMSTVARGVCYNSASCALVGVMMAPEMGAIGGALFGAVRQVTKITSIFVGHELGLLNPSTQSSATKLVSRAVIHFASYVPAWGALTYAGFSLSFSRIVVITVADLIFSTMLPVGIPSSGTSLRQASAN